MALCMEIENQPGVAPSTLKTKIKKDPISPYNKLGSDQQKIIGLVWIFWVWKIINAINPPEN